MKIEISKLLHYIIIKKILKSLLNNILRDCWWFVSGHAGLTLGALTGVVGVWGGVVWSGFGLGWYGFWVEVGARLGLTTLHGTTANHTARQQTARQLRARHGKTRHDTVRHGSKRHDTTANI